MSHDDLSHASQAASTTTLARADLDSLPSGSTGPATGNVITGNATISGHAGADSVASAPGMIVEVEGAEAASPAANGSFVVTGQYGTLTIAADGSYSYTRSASAPDGAEDVFNYTLADHGGHKSSSTLTIELGAVLPAEAATAAVNGIPGVVVLPAGVSLSDVHVVGSDLVIHMPDGTDMVIPNGAIFVPQLVIGDVEVPATNLAALLIDSEPQPAAGPAPSSGGNFAVDVPPLDPGVPLGDLLPPTELVFTPPDFQEVNGFVDHKPPVIIETPDNPVGAVDATAAVSEAGLPARLGESEGSDAAANSESTTGTIVFQAQDGLDSITIDGVAITAVGQQFAGAQGVLTITGIDLANGEITYTYAIADNTNPGGDAVSDHFTVVVTDSDGDSSAANLTIHIQDDSPTAHDDSGTQSAENAPVTVNVIANDVQGADSVANDHIALVDGSLSGTGSVHYNGDGTFTYTPGQNENGDVTFDYQITDGDGDTSTATVTIHLFADSTPTISLSGDTGVDEAGLPTRAGEGAGSDSGSDSETATGTINITTGSDTVGSVVIVDKDGKSIDVTNGGTVHGDSGALTVTLANGVYTYSYTLTDNTSGDATSDSFAVTVTDSDGDHASTTLTVDIADDRPTANPDSGSQTVEDAPVTVNVIGNDVQGADSVANDHISYVAGSLSGGAGTVTYNGDGTFTYAPVAGETGTVTFDYQIVDGDGDPSTATVTIDLLANSTPAISVSGDNSVDEAALSFGSDPSSDAETAIGSINIATGGDTVGKLMVGSTDVTNGGTVDGASGTLTITHNADGTYSYSYTLASATTDVPNQAEVDSFAVTVTDSDGDSASTNLVISIVDDVPTAHADVGSVSEGGSTSGDVLLNDVLGADGAHAGGAVTGVATGSDTTAAVSGNVGMNIVGTYGTLHLNADGSYSYAANADAISADAIDYFVYTVTDGDGDTSTTTLDIKVADVSLSPNDQVQTASEAALDTGSNPGSTAETVTGQLNVTGATTYAPQTIVGTHGTIHINADGSYSYTLTSPFDGATADNGGNIVNGVEDFTYTAQDAGGNTVTGHITINVVDDVPTAQADSNSTDEGGSTSGNVLANDVLGADGAAPGGAVTGVATGSNTANAVSGNVGTDIKGDFGTLHLGAGGVYTYTADPNAVTADAVDHFVYTITDGDGDTSTVKLDITVNDVTLSPNDQVKIVNEAALDTTTSGSDLGHGTVSGSNPGSSAETVTGQLAVSGTGVTYAAQDVTTAKGIFHLNTDGSYTYTLIKPVTGTTADNGTNTVNGVDSFTYTATDSDGNSVTGHITINVTDDVPTAHSDSNSVNEGGSAGGNVLTNDVLGADGGTVTGVATGSNTASPVSGNVGTDIKGDFGTLHLGAGGVYTYTADPNAVTADAVDHFVYTITDGDGDTSTVKLDITVNDVTLSPNDQVKTVSEAALDTTTSGSDLGHGTVSGSNPESGAETVTGQLAVSGAGVTYAPQSVTTANGTFELKADGSYTYTLTDPVHGSTADNGTNTVNGVDSFTYTATDSNGNSVTGTVTINVTDDIPTAHVDTGSVDEGGLLSVSIANGVLSNDVLGADGGAVTGVATGSNTVNPVSGNISTDLKGAFGTLHLNANGSYTYTADPNSVTADAVDHFVYTITDGDGDTSTVKLDINVNDVSLSGNDQVKTVSEAALDTTTTGSDLDHGSATGSNPGSAAETVTGQLAVSGATGYTAQDVTTANGMFHLAADGSYTYTLINPFDGTTANNGTNTQAGVDQFTYTAHDANGNTVTGTVTINVIDDVPTASADSGNVSEGGSLSVNTANGVLSNDVLGADGGTLTGVATGSNTANPVSGNVGTDIKGAFGTLHLNANGSYTYTADPNTVTANAVDHFVYTITDGDGDKSTSTLDINVANVSLGADNQVKTVDEAALDTATSGSDLGHGIVTGSNPGSSAETVTGQLAVSGATGYTPQTVTTANGMFELNADGSYTYTLTGPVHGSTANNGADTVNGVETFTYTAHDADGNTVTGTVKINVTDDVPTLGTVQNQQTNNSPATAPAVGTLHFESGADGAGSAMTISANLAGITSGGHSLIAVQSGNVLTAYQDVNGDGIHQASETSAVFTLTVDPNAGTSGQYTFDLLQALDPTLVDTPVGGTTSFGAGPQPYQVVSQTSVGTDPLAILTGWHTDASFNEADWFNGTDQLPAGVTIADVNGSNAGWGVDNNNFTAGELMRFDFGEPPEDFDGPGGYAPPNPAVNLPTISTATFETIGYASGGTFEFVLHYTDGTSSNATFSGAGTFTLTAESGKFIDWIDAYTPDAGSGKIDLVSVGVQSSSIDKTLGFSVQLSDGDGDLTSTSNFTVHVKDGLTPLAPAAPVVLDLNGDGVHFLATDAGVAYDYGSGKVATAWASPEDGILVRDSNHNGTVDNASEFVFGGNGVTDLQALAANDTNHDGQLTAADSGFGNFAIWQDANSNGVVESGEVQTLAAHGITAISLGTYGVAYEAAGGDVSVAGTGSYTRGDGSTGALADAAFLTASRSSDDVRVGSAANGNTGIVIGALAAAGLAASQPLAAATLHDHFLASADHASLVVAQHTQALAPVTLESVSAAHASALAPEGDAKTAAPAAHSAPSHPDEAQASGLLGNHAAANHEAPTDLPHGTDAPAHEAVVSQTPVSAATVAMPSAAMMQGVEGSQAPDGAQHNAVIGKVLADSLAGGQGGHSAIDAALAHLSSHGGETGPLQVLASHDAATVPTWHSAEAAAFAAAHTVFSMEAVMLHPDAAPAAHG